VFHQSCYFVHDLPPARFPGERILEQSHPSAHVSYSSFTCIKSTVPFPSARSCGGLGFPVVPVVYLGFFPLFGRGVCFLAILLCCSRATPSPPFSSHTCRCVPCVHSGLPDPGSPHYHPCLFDPRMACRVAPLCPLLSSSFPVFFSVAVTRASPLSSKCGTFCSFLGDRLILDGTGCPPRPLLFPVLLNLVHVTAVVTRQALASGPSVTESVSLYGFFNTAVYHTSWICKPAPH